MLNKIKAGFMEFKAKKDANEIQKIIEKFQLEPLTDNEIEFYTSNMEDDGLRLMILKYLSQVKDFNPTILLRCSRRDFNILCVMIAKSFIANGNELIGELLLSNRTTSTIDYNIDEIFEVISKNCIDGLSDNASKLMQHMLTFIKPIVVSACINTRKLVAYHDEKHNEEVVIQPKDVTSGIISITLGGC